MRIHELIIGIHNSVMDIPLESIRSWPLVSLCIYSISADTRRKWCVRWDRTTLPLRPRLHYIKHTVHWLYCSGCWFHLGSAYWHISVLFGDRNIGIAYSYYNTPLMEPPTMLLVPICRDMQLWWDKPPTPSSKNRMPGDTCFDDVSRICACVTWTQMYVTLQTKNVFHSKAVIILFFHQPLC